MPWRGPAEPGEYPTLGYQVGDWIEAHCVIPDGVDQGRPYLLTDEMWAYLLRYYRLRGDVEYDRYRPSAPMVYRGGQLMRPQKWGKGPYAASITLAEAFGPVRFGGWDSYGEPVGMPHPTPWCQLVATSEEQTDNTWLSLFEMATRGAIADFAGVDIGVEDLNLPGGGKIEPKTSSGRARLGARITFALFDESGLMTEGNGGVVLATTMKRNLGGMGGRWMETTNAPDPSEMSVAQRTQESKAPGILIDYRRPPRVPDLDDDADALEILRYLYEASWWVDPVRILEDARDPSVCPTPNDALRFFFNLPMVGSRDVVNPTRWDAAARPSTLARRDRVALGFDGSRTTDRTALVASRLADGRWFVLGVWDPADYPGDDGPQRMRREVYATLAAAFGAYRVSYLFMDTPLWEEAYDTWSARWPDRVVQQQTATPIRMDRIITRSLTRFAASDFTHDGNEELARQVKAAVLARGQRRQHAPNEDTAVPVYYQRVTKKRGGRPIDLLVAGMLAEAARGQAIEEGALARPGPAAGRPKAVDNDTLAPASTAAGSPWRSGSSPWRGGASPWR